MIRPNPRRTFNRSLRSLPLVSLTLLGIALSCGGNPELSVSDSTVSDGAGLGEHCNRTEDCAADLLCSDDEECVESCGNPTSKACGSEACLPSGECSRGAGKKCDDDEDCKSPLRCSSLGRCGAPCDPGSEDACKGGKVCYDDGTCPNDNDVVLGGLGGAGNGGGEEGSGGAGSCIDVEVNFEPQVPTVLLLIDRSGSMSDEGNFGEAVQQAVDDGSYALGDCPSNNDWRWNVVRDVLFNPDKGIVKPLEDRVRFGLSLYTSENGVVDEDSPEEVDPSKTCPMLIDVPIALGNHQAMLDQYLCSDIGEDTPTGESLLAAAETLDAFDEPGPKIIVLATDGLPDNCECPDFGGPVPAKCEAPDLEAQVRADVVATAEEIHTHDITIHVINVSTPGNAELQQHLTDLAQAGGGEVYPGFSPGALSRAFEEIIDGVRSCKIDLDGEIAEGKESSGTVTLDGEELELDDEDGWQVNTPSQIELLGDACEAIKSGDHDLDITFPCESFEPVVH